MVIMPAIVPTDSIAATRSGQPSNLTFNIYAIIGPGIAAFKIIIASVVRNSKFVKTFSDYEGRYNKEDLINFLNKQ